MGDFTRLALVDAMPHAMAGRAIACQNHDFLAREHHFQERIGHMAPRTWQGEGGWTSAHGLSLATS
jgi:hypothetical protein